MVALPRPQRQVPASYVSTPPARPAAADLDAVLGGGPKWLAEHLESLCSDLSMHVASGEFFLALKTWARLGALIRRAGAVQTSFGDSDD